MKEYVLQTTDEDEDLEDLPIQDVAQWLEEPDEQPRPLIEDLVERGSCVAIVGPAKSAKTWLEIQTAVCIASGRDWFGRKVTRQIVYVANFDMPSHLYKKRLRSVCKKLGVDPAELRGRLCIDNLHREKEYFDLCVARAVCVNADVMIIDPFCQVFEGSERDNAQYREAIEQIKSLSKLCMTIFIVCHTRKDFRKVVDICNNSPRLNGFLGNVIAILPQATDKNARVIDCSVLRDYPAPEPFSVKFDEDALVLAPDIMPEVI